MSILSQALFASYVSNNTPPPPTYSMSFISSNTGKTQTTDTITNEIPNCQDGDIVFAFVMTRSDVIVPTGWTFVATRMCVGTLNQYLFIYRKNLVLASDSGTSITFNQQSVARMSLAMIACRSNTGNFSIAQIASNNLNNVDTLNITPEVVTAQNDNELFVVTATTISSIPEPTIQGTLNDFTIASGVSTDNRLTVQYKIANQNYSNSGEINMVPAGGAVTNNGLSSIMMRIKATA